MTSITSSGETTAIQKHMTPLKLSEGQYWGLDMAIRGDRIVLAGYHRDIATSGAWLDSNLDICIAFETLLTYRIHGVLAMYCLASISSQLKATHWRSESVKKTCIYCTKK